MKKQKLTLQGLKVQSYITTHKEVVKGGFTPATSGILGEYAAYAYNAGYEFGQAVGEYFN